MSQLGTPELTWRRLDVLMRFLPNDCAIYRSMNDDVLGWDLHAQLLAVIADAVNIGNWQRGGNPKAKRPPRIPRPGVTPDTVEGTTEVIGTDVRPVEEIRSIFARHLDAARKSSDDDD